MILIKGRYNLVMNKDFDGNIINDDYWFKFYLPQWSSREKSQPSYSINDSILRLYISDDQKPWCPEWNGEVRVSNLQTGVFSGKLLSNIGQHYFTEGLLVREEPKKEIKVAPHYGFIEMKARCIMSKENVAALWLIGIEDTSEKSAEICIFELKGWNVTEKKSIIGYGVHPFGDPNLEECFFEEKFDLNIEEWNTYEIDWRPEGIDFYINGKLIKTINEAPNYQMQLMINLYDLENIHNENNIFEIDYIRVYELNYK